MTKNNVLNVHFNNADEDYFKDIPESLLLITTHILNDSTSNETIAKHAQKVMYYLACRSQSMAVRLESQSYLAAHFNLEIQD